MPNPSWFHITFSHCISYREFIESEDSSTVERISQDMRLDTLITNAHILTGTADRPTASRIGIWQGLIVGMDEELDPVLTDPDAVGPARVFDAGGATIVAGFNDVHAHSVWFGQTLIEIDLADAANPEDVYVAITQDLADFDTDQWIICSNYNPLQMTDAVDRDRLDEAAAGRPVLIKHRSGHAYTVNGVGLQRAGIPDIPETQPDGGEIVTDDSGRATGLLDENAMRAVQDILQPEALEDVVSALAAASEHYLSEGLTSVTDAGIAGGWIGHTPREFAAYQLASQRGLLKHRSQTMITMDALHELSGHPNDHTAHGLDAGIRSGLGDNRLQIGPVKVFTDGSLLGATAAMTEEYAHCAHNHGYMQGNPDEMRQSVIDAAGAGWALALHAIGDAAIDFAIETIVEARRIHGPGPMPDRIEHGGVVRDDQIERMADQNIVLVPQPYFISAFGEGMLTNLGAERADLSYPARRLLDAGMTLPGSSDRPVAHGAPLAVIQAFAQRLTEAGNPYGLDDRISVAEAIRAYTIGSAEATGWGGTKGVLATGYLADLVVLGANPLETDIADISAIPVVATMVGGVIEYGNIPAN